MRITNLLGIAGPADVHLLAMRDGEATTTVHNVLATSRKPGMEESLRWH